jgi:hypothetical protein
VDQTSGTIPTEATADGQPGFGSRGRIRRRARFLRKARELAYRDLGGLVFNLHRFGERNDSLVLAKLATLSHIDTELRTIESSLGQPSPITVLREAGITACPRCAAIHGSEDRFCPNCGLPLSRHVDLPIAGAGSAQPATPPPTPPAAAAPAAAPAPAAAAAPAAAPAPAAAAAPAPAPAPAAPAPAATAPAPAAAAPAATSAPPAAAETVPAPAEAVQHQGRAPSPPARAATPAGPPRASPSEPGDSTEVLHPQTPGQ